MRGNISGEERLVIAWKRRFRTNVVPCRTLSEGLSKNKRGGKMDSVNGDVYGENEEEGDSWFEDARSAALYSESVPILVTLTTDAVFLTRIPDIVNSGLLFDC